jgi:hypothetical protein
VVEVDDVFADGVVVERLGKFGSITVADGGVAKGRGLGCKSASQCGGASYGACNFWCMLVFPNEVERRRRFATNAYAISGPFCISGTVLAGGMQCRLVLFLPPESP